MATGDWWTVNLTPGTGCRTLRLPPESRDPGCRACWMPAMLKARPDIHGRDADGEPLPPWELQTHPERLARLLRMKRAQRAGWINWEPSWFEPEYLAACMGVALARPDHGIGLLTSRPGALLERTKWFDGHATRPASYCAERAWQLLEGKGRITYRDEDWPPRNVIVLCSISTQAEADARLPSMRELGRMGWRWGIHAEPLLELVSVLPNPFDLERGEVPSWIVAGAAKGYETTAAELHWYRMLRVQAHLAGAPFWLKSLGRERGRMLDGRTHDELPAGWPA